MHVWALLILGSSPCHVIYVPSHLPPMSYHICSITLTPPCYVTYVPSHLMSHMFHLTYPSLRVITHAMSTPDPRKLPIQQPQVPHFLPLTSLTSVCPFVGFSFPLSAIVLHIEPVPFHLSRPYIPRVYLQSTGMVIQMWPVY